MSQCPIFMASNMSLFLTSYQNVDIESDLESSYNILSSKKAF